MTISSTCPINTTSNIDKKYAYPGQVKIALALSIHIFFPIPSKSNTTEPDTVNSFSTIGHFVRV